MTRTALLPAVLLLAACALSPPSGFPVPGTMPRLPPPSDAPTEPGKPLTVPEVVLLALRGNPDLGAAAARIAASEQEVRVARSSYMPRISVGGGYTHTTDPVQVFTYQLRQRDLSMTGDFNHPGSYGNTRASLIATWLLLDGGRRAAGENMAMLATIVEQGNRAAMANELKASVISTCLAVYEAREFMKVAGKSVALVTEQLRIAQSRFDAGSAQRSDVLSVEVRLAEAKEEVVRAKNAEERALSALRSLAGVRAAAPFSLAEAPGFRVPPVEEEKPFETALANRPEVARGMRGVDLARAEVGLREADRSAMVSVFGSWDFDDRGMEFSSKRDSRTGGVLVDLPLFEGGRTEAQIAAARAHVREAEERLRGIVLMVEADVRRAELDLAEADERLKVSEKSEQQAEEALSMIRARYESGAATITESLDAETALTGARVRRVAARYEVERATADLRRALGICRAGAEDQGEAAR